MTTMTIALPQILTPIGVTLYDGPSLIDGKRIVAVATGIKEKSANRKTGKMIQVWIIRTDQHPNEALKNGDDESVCGSCKHRHFRSCYVNIAHGPAHVWKAWSLGKYAEYSDDCLSYFSGKYIRFGAYGDPAAVPTEVWARLSMVAAGTTGYTHRWKKCDPELKNYCMASTELESEAIEAKSRGWKTFYVRTPGTELPAGYFECPASKASGQRLTCQECMACSGGEGREGQGMPSIEAHGPNWKLTYFQRGIKALRQKKKYVGINDKPLTKGYEQKRFANEAAA